MAHYVEGMFLPLSDDPSYLIATILVGLLAWFINLLIIYLVIRLAITHGMLSFARQRDEDAGQLPIHRD